MRYAQFSASLVSLSLMLFVPARPTAAEPQRVLKGHVDTIYRLAFSPDGRWLVSSSEDATTRVWDVQRGQATVLPGKRASLSPDGTRVAISGGGGLRVWKLSSGKLLAQSKDVRHYCPCVAWSPDGKNMIVCPASERQDTLLVVDADTLKVRRQIKTNTSPLMECLFSPRGRMVAVGGGPYDKPRQGEEVSLWDIDTGRKLAYVPAHDGRITGLAFSPHGTLLATVGQDRKIKIWNVPDFAGDLETTAAAADRAELIDEAIKQLNDDDFKVRKKASTDLRQLGRAAVTALEKALNETESPEVRERVQAILKHVPPAPRLVPQGQYPQPGHNLPAVAFSPDGNLLASVNMRGDIILWDTRAQAVVGRREGAARHCGDLAFSPDGRQIAYTPNGEIHILNLAELRQEHAIRHLRNLRARIEQVEDGTVAVVDLVMADNLQDDDFAHLSSLPTTKKLLMGYRNRKVTERGAMSLKSLTSLKALALGGTQAGDRWLKHVADMKHLQQLYLAGTNVTDAGLDHLSELSELRLLILSNTAVTDEGLTRLTHLTKLETLHLLNTKATDEGVEQLQRALPRATIIR
jgi:WD40 repeat protein